MRTPPLRTTWKPSLEPLEDRATPANIKVVSAALESPTTIGLKFQSNGVPAFVAAVYRSADGTLSGDDVLITAAVVPGAAARSQTARIDLPSELPIDPDLSHVIVVADPGGAVAETKENDNVGKFRKLSMAVVTHGLQLDGSLPEWVGELAADLRDAGYDRVVAYDWAASSGTLVSGAAVRAGAGMAGQVRSAAGQLGSKTGDVVDVHFIGHSRGGVVIGEALRTLEGNPGKALRHGYVRMTLLDPHPAANRGTRDAGNAELGNGTGVSTVGSFSFDPANATFAAQTVLLFQSIAADPRVVVPANVDRAETFYQRLAWNRTTPGGFEDDLGLNLWGELPAQLDNRSGRPVLAVNVSATPTGGSVGHTEVQTWYIANLGTYLPL